jgi:hypothetical protein
MGLVAPLDEPVERLCARIASSAHGVVTRAELLAAGVSSDEIKHRLHTGGLIRVHRGVYRVGHWAPSVEARYLAAVRACGDGAVLSGRAAAYLYGIIKGGPPRPEVTAPKARRIPGVRVRRSRRMDAIRTTTWRGIPVTTVAQTVVDLAAELGEEALARACHEAGARHHTTPAQVAAVIALFPRAPGTGKLRRILGGDAPVVLSRLERRFLELVREAGLPPPVTNRPAGSKRVDCRWPDHRLTVELDSYRFHNSRHSWEQDRLREREARARGDECRRYTWADVVENPAPMLSELRRLLAVA